MLHLSSSPKELAVLLIYRYQNDPWLRLRTDALSYLSA
jgi:hypothetical protein